MIFFWFRYGVQNDKKTPSSGKNYMGWGVDPLKLTQIFFLPFFSKNVRFTEHFVTKFIQIGLKIRFRGQTLVDLHVTWFLNEGVGHALTCGSAFFLRYQFVFFAQFS